MLEVADIGQGDLGDALEGVLDQKGLVTGDDDIGEHKQAGKFHLDRRLGAYRLSIHNFCRSASVKMIRSKVAKLSSATCSLATLFPSNILENP